MVHESTGCPQEVDLLALSFALSSLHPSFLLLRREVAARSAEQRTDCCGLRWAIAAESVSRLAAAAATCLVFLPDASAPIICCSKPNSSPAYRKVDKAVIAMARIVIDDSDDFFR
ncbi:hypothetical protein STEG23_032410 [Scotinomys teguina]